MVKTTIKFRDGGSKEFDNTYPTVYKGFCYIWRKGHKTGDRYVAKYRLSKIHSKKKTGQKGIFVE